MSYCAVLFDLFDTLVSFDRNRLPEIQVNGKVMRSTAGKLHEALRPFAPRVELDAFVSALGWSWQEAERLRNEDYREVDGLRLPFRVKRTGGEADLVIEWSEIRHNVAIDDARFERP